MAAKAKKTHPAITDQHVKNAQEIAQILQQLKSAGNAQPAEPTEANIPPPSGVSPLGGTAR
jgi:hypothetical protein